MKQAINRTRIHQLKMIRELAQAPAGLASIKKDKIGAYVGTVDRSVGLSVDRRRTACRRLIARNCGRPAIGGRAADLPPTDRPTDLKR